MTDKQTKIKVIHLERCLLPETVTDLEGVFAATRPEAYAPPS